MGHKKHKKEHKHKHKHDRKRKHSDSESGDEEKRKEENGSRHKKKHKKEKKREKKYEDDAVRVDEVEIIEEIETHEPQPQPTIPSPPPQADTPAQVEQLSSGMSQDSLSVEETNALRAKLGLKPLNVGGGNEEGAGRGDDEFVHQPPTNISDVKKQDKIREKLLIAKQKRSINKKLLKVKTLGESDDDDAAANWVERSRKRELAKKKEKEILSAEDEFGVGDLVSDELGRPNKTSHDSAKHYTEKDLKGLSVEHNVENFAEGRSAVLVIKDKDILDEDDEDVLHSVNIDDLEKAQKNVEVKRKGYGYSAYEQEEVDDYGFFKARVVLSKYDEEIDGEKKNRFTIGNRGVVDTTWEQQREQMQHEIRAKGESLTLPPLKLATEYLTQEELTFKKRKKKVRKVRKRQTLKPDDLLPLPGDQAASSTDHGSRVTKPPPMDEENGEIYDEDDAAEDLQRALEKSRRVKEKKKMTEEDGSLVKKQLDHIQQLPLDKPNFSTEIYLNATDEFCRQLGTQLTSSREEKAEEADEAGDVAVGDDDMDIDDDDDDDVTSCKWNSVNENDEAASSEPNKHQDADDHVVIEAEPLAATGLMGALKLAQRKGYLADGEKVKGNSIVETNISQLKAKHYSIEDKNAVDYLDKYAHEKYSKDRSNRYDRGGMTVEFSEKKDYKPKIAIEYVDNHGRALSCKEAFRKLSHRFHGKGSGKSKEEKRMKKHGEEDTMKHMSSTDTPLNTVAMMVDKQRTEASPYIVLSGGGKTLMTGGGETLKK